MCVCVCVIVLIGISEQILQLLKTRERKEVKIEEILTLLLYLASLGGPSTIPDHMEYSFTNALSQAFVEDKEKNCQVLSNLCKDKKLFLRGFFFNFRAL